MASKRDRSSPASPAKRRVETRTPKPTDSTSHLSISFKFFQDSDSIGQSIADWGRSGLLESFFEKLVHLSKTDITTLQSQGSLTNYRKFPSPDITDFKCPSNLRTDDSWGVIKKVGGQKPRVAGFLENGVFYIVFLDKNHKFWKSEL